MSTQYTSPENIRGEKKRGGKEKRPHSAGYLLSFCIDNGLETLTPTPTIHSYKILVTNLRNILVASLLRHSYFILS